MEARKAVRSKQARLRDLVAEHGEVLHRDRAVKEAKAVVTGDLLL